ncbi:MAG TPA: serine hydrolase [Chloroflexus aurantiacus]|jgi:CubicO group peptidase (beta-lactamase class C family)|uniref:Beta-lactamase n=1 Tax=Chloroflexus aurantiacus (strain ATCC 29366 / DSM 635 / J-10-fl) TaxID=324602 RepID=A9WHL9_CHLAA|nr:MULTISPECIES: serine hydrolase domain-containing protein [Chloroflexus]ABY36345.1 beta-lactamase [Chloroflexus aurantiacus J-10-fl]RMG46714.1 MAG: serine hydrolase [Chloroflexota bacterium]HBW65961.1 serine hydrolase [Chloroflexus aurantiacus]
MNLRAHLEQLRTEMNVPALAAFVVSHESTLAADVVGLRHADHPNDPLTLVDYFQIGSNAKAFIATTCAALVEKGLITWNTPVASLFPELSGAILPPYRTITLRHLLQHRSGLPAYTDTDSPDFILPDFDNVPDSAHVNHFAIWLMQTCPPRDPPGSQFTYSNAGYSLAAAILERAAESPWNLLLDNLVLRPLNIQAYPGIQHPARINAAQPWGHWFENGIYHPCAVDQEIVPPCFAPAGDMCISLPDYARFLQFHLKGLQGKDDLLPAALIQTLHNDGALGQGMGWGINALRGMESLGRWSLHAGSTGTFYAIAALSHDYNLGFALFTNAGVPELTFALKSLISNWFRL